MMINRKTEAHSEPSWTSKMELFAEIVKNFHPLTIFAKSSALDPRLHSDKNDKKIMAKIIPYANQH